MEPSLKLQVLKTGRLIGALIIVPVIGKLIGVHIGVHILVPVIYFLFLRDPHIHQVCSYLVRNVTVWILCRGAIIKCGNWRQALPGRCQETSGHGRKPNEPHNFGAQELMERVHASSITGHKRMPAETPEELMERVHVSSTGIHDQRKRSTLHKRFCVVVSKAATAGYISNPELSMRIFGLPRRPDLDVSQCCNGNVRWSPPDPMVNSCCYHLDGKNVCIPKVFWTPANPYTAHFYLDSGACYHMTGNQFILKAYPDYLNIVLPTQSVSGIDGSPLPVSGCGFVNSTSIRLDCILYVEGLVANLVSVAQLAVQYSVRIVFEANLFTIEKIQTGEKIGQGHREGNHYVLDHFLPKYLLVENPACFV